MPLLLHLLNDRLLLWMPQQLCNTKLTASWRLLLLLLLCLRQVLQWRLAMHALLELLHRQRPLLLLLLPLQAVHQNLLLLLWRQLAHLQLALADLHNLLWRELQSTLLGPGLSCYNALL